MLTRHCQMIKWSCYIWMKAGCATLPHNSLNVYKYCNFPQLGI